jgi:hypothetical protein
MFQPEYTTSLYSDSLGRGRVTGYTATNAYNSDRNETANKYTSLYKSLQRVFIRGNYLTKVNEINIFAIPYTHDNSQDVQINGFKIVDNSHVQKICDYLQHFYDTGEQLHDISNDFTTKLKAVKNPFTPKFFDDLEALQNYCQRTIDDGHPAGEAQGYFFKMKEKNNF